MLRAWLQQQLLESVSEGRFVVATVPTHFRHVVRGKFLGSSEIWSFGTHWSRSVALGPDAGLDQVNESAVTAALADLVSHVSLSSMVEVTDWRFYQIGSDGKMEGDGPLIHEFASGELKGSGTRVLPPQVALVVSKVSDHRGPAQFGRFYLPASALSVNAADGRLTSAAAAGVHDNVVVWAKAVSDAIDIPGTIQSATMVNVSRSPVGTGTLQDVDHLRVGLALDTLRTRRNALKEDYYEGGQIDW